MAVIVQCGRGGVVLGVMVVSVGVDVGCGDRPWWVCVCMGGGGGGGEGTKKKINKKKKKNTKQKKKKNKKERKIGQAITHSKGVLQYDKPGAVTYYFN